MPAQRRNRKPRGTKPATDAVKYQLIREQLMEEIRSGRLAPGQRLSSDQQMARRFDASRGTVIRALLDLTHAGLVERRRGSGSYVKAAGASTARWVALLGPAPASEPSHTTTLGLIAQSVAGEAGRRGIGLLHQAISNQAPPSAQVLDEQLGKVIQQKPNGVFFFPFPIAFEGNRARNHEIVTRFSQAGIPVVLLDNDIVPQPARSDLDLVSMDHRQAGALVTSHMVDIGCRRVAFICIETGVPSVEDRIAGYRRVLADRDLSESEMVFVRHPLKREALEEILRTNRPDGLIFKDDAQAALASRLLTEAGHRVGEDFALAGFGDWPLASLLGVPLTTVRQPVDAIARNAVSLMLDRIADPHQAGRHVTLGCELIVRESTSRYGGSK